MRLPEQYYRAGVGAVIFNRRGNILALERADIPGAWQMPQGGLKAAEAPVDAVFREVAEETGIGPHALQLIDTYPEPLVYDLPAGARNTKTGRGQVQYWFLIRFEGQDGSIDVKAGGEFRAWQWIPFQSLLTSVAEFRKPLYQRIAERFGSLIQ